jgi:DUF1680 family protein
MSGGSLQGDTFFYQNPLQNGGRGGRGGGGRRGGAGTPATVPATAQANAAELGGTGPGRGAQGPRQAWFDVACCPANLARFVAQFPGCIYATRGDARFINYFVNGQADASIGGKKLRLSQETRFPWEGDIKLTISPETPGEFALNVRIPCWSQGKPLPTDLYTYLPAPASADRVSLKVNGQPVAPEIKEGFASIRRAWNAGDTVEIHLPLEVRQVIAHEKVEADRGLVAIERGPLVYCVEGIDNGGTLPPIALGANATFSSEFKADLLGGVTVVKAKSADREITAVPYHVWGNRGNGEMRVWLTRAAN